MNFNEYQVAAHSTASYPDKGDNMVYPALGLAGEAGETVDKIKKIYRNRNVTSGKQITADEHMALVREMGDVLWYIAALASELRVPLEHVAEINIAKLLDRQVRGVIKSEGDNR
jgi:NTP pyrophosphatase (non-canonical NTP hydrolase)